MRKSHKNIFGAGALTLALVANIHTASALTISFDFTDIENNASLDAATRAQVEHAYDVAAQQWTSRLIDPITVNLRVGYASLGSNILAQTGSSANSVSLAAYRAALAGDVTSYVDTSAVQHVPTDLVRYFENPHGNPGITGANASRNDLRNLGPLYNSGANGITDDNTHLFVNTATLKAVGLAPVYTNDPNDPLNNNVVLGAQYDGRITFNSDFGFYLGADTHVPSDQYDFVTVAAHEIGHALGFTSGVDTFDVLSGRGPFRNFFGTLAPTASIGDFLGADYDNQGAVIRPWDLFRYSNLSFDSNGNFLGNDLTTALGINQIRLEDILSLNALNVPTSNPYFSIDGGLTDLGPLSSGSFNGARINVPACFPDPGTPGSPFINLPGQPCPAGFTLFRATVSNSQASHYIDSFVEDPTLGLPISLLDPTGAPGAFYGPTSLDLLTLDAIGYDVPEPTAISLLGLGIVALGWTRRRKRG